MASTPHVPVRTCVGCRRKAPRAQLLRLVLTDGGELFVDARAVRPGRGAWIHPDPACLELAERRRALGRALRTTGSPDVTPVRAWIASREEQPGPHGPTGRTAAGPTDSKGG
ncbi:MAG: YlxR family protein [Actinomyces sp.]|uniref:YlxR family protein n=1 Tax=Actinomyces sp. TaxID=29317 RepID=UPI0026DD5FA9|nr:YlxR family protein [Actinomyces sp.]MDO4243916.1 YlxR family protein [Actinomyces sp.]